MSERPDCKPLCRGSGHGAKRLLWVTQRLRSRAAGRSPSALLMLCLKIGHLYLQRAFGRAAAAPRACACCRFGCGRVDWHERSQDRGPGEKPQARGLHLPQKPPGRSPAADLSACPFPRSSSRPLAGSGARVGADANTPGLAQGPSWLWQTAPSPQPRSKDLREETHLRRAAAVKGKGPVRRSRPRQTELSPVPLAEVPCDEGNGPGRGSSSWKAVTYNTTGQQS